MGNQQSKTVPLEIKYLISTRKDPVHFKINDDFPYPRRPKTKEIDQQFSEILKICILTEEQNQELASLKDEIKWKLICKHRYFTLTAKQKSPESSKQKCKAQVIIEGLKVSESIGDMEQLNEWLTKEAKESDINDFLLYDGLNVLLSILMRAETCSRATKNYNKQLIVLQIFDFLSTFQQVVNALVQIPKAVNAIFLNFNKTQLALNKFVLHTLTNISWNSKEGPHLVLAAIGSYKLEFGYKVRFEPFIQILEEGKNVVLIEMVTMFINTLIESPLEEDKRGAIRSEFMMLEIRNIYQEIKDKIKQGKYKIEDSVYIPRRGSDDPQSPKKHGDTSSFFLLDEKDQFDEKLSSILKQIEIFEKGFEEFIEEEDDDDEDEDSEEFEENPNTFKKRATTSKKKTMNFSDINDVFSKVVSKTLSSENYENFFKILQQLSLLPSNEQGKKIWNALNSNLQSLTGVKQDSVMKVESLEALIENTESKEQLEQKLLFLDTQLKARDDELKNLKRGKLNMEIQLKGSKKEAERYEKELIKHMESFKTLEIQLAELKKNPNSPELQHSSAKKQNETINIHETGGTNSPNIIKKITQNVDDKKSTGLEKKVSKKGAFGGGVDSKGAFGSDSKSPEKNNVGSVGETEIKLVAESEEKINRLNKKIAELERFISTGIDEGFTSKQYSKMQTNLETLGFPPLKKKFKVHKPTNSETQSNENPNKKGSINNQYSFENSNEGLNFDKNVSFSTNISANDRGGNNNNNINTGNNNNNGTGVGSGTNMTNDNVGTNNNTLEKKSTIQIVITNPSGHQPVKNTFEDKVAKRESLPVNLGQDSQDSRKENTQPSLLKLTNLDSKDNEEKKSPEIKKEEKIEEIKILPPPPIINSEVSSPTNSPLNVAPLPPPLFGSKPGIPPGLNILNLLKKQMGPVKEKKRPNVPMKQILWTLVNPLNIKGTIWETIDENTVSYEIPLLESEFTSVRPDKPQPKSNIPAKITLLAPNRFQNVSIVLSKIKMSPSSIVENILTVNVDILNLNIVNCLLDAIPTPDEISLISNYCGDVDMLENPEKYILEIKDVKCLKVRLQAMQFFFTHQELFDDLQLKIRKLIELFENISKEQRIIVLMKYTLAIGNYMNGESARGGAFGFKLDVFDKMGDVKNINGKKNLLAYVVEEIERNTGNVFIDVNEEFPLYEFGRRQPISQLFADLDFIKKGIEQVKTAKENKNEGVIDKIQEFMGQFESDVRDKSQDIELDLKTLDQKYKRVCAFYCEDPSQTSSEVFVESFNKIWVLLKKAKAILVKENKEQLKDKLKEKAMEKAAGFLKGIFFS